MAREKHMLEAEKSSAKLHFMSALEDRPSREVPMKVWEAIQREKPYIGFLQHNTPIF